MQIRALVHTLAVVFWVLTLVLFSASAVYEMTIPEFDFEASQETTFDVFAVEFRKIEKERTDKTMVGLYLRLMGCLFNFGAGICGLVLTDMDFDQAPARARKIFLRLLSAPDRNTSLRVPAAPVVPEVPKVPDVLNVSDA